MRREEEGDIGWQKTGRGEGHEGNTRRQWVAEDMREAERGDTG